MCPPLSLEEPPDAGGVLVLVVLLESRDVAHQLPALENVREVLQKGKVEGKNEGEYEDWCGRVSRYP